MSKIREIKAREILDSRGNPTVEVDVLLDSGVLGRAGVPSGASTGAHEAHELRDGDSNRYLGKGVTKVVDNVNQSLSRALCGKSVEDLSAIDQIMLDLDGTENKNNLGANAILGVSMACAKALSTTQQKSLFRTLAVTDEFKLPVPLMNVINGGAHADNGLDVQEFMIVPVLGESFATALRAGAEIFHHLKKILLSKKLATGIGDEGGFAPVLGSNEEAMNLLVQSIELAGYRPGEEVKIALDVAATELCKDGKYRWEGQEISSEELGDVYASWAEKYPLVSIEDGFDEDDWTGWSNFNARLGDRLQLVGDDLFVTNPKRIQTGIDQKAANALLVKVNQIGTLSETAAAVKLAQSAGFHTVMSHRSGETEDTLIADLAVALGSEQIKTGSLCRGERICKYNQLLRIEEELGSKAIYRGQSAFQV